MRKLKLSLDKLAVETFAADAERDGAKGTVAAHEQETYERVCYTPVIDCYTVRWICRTEPVEDCW